MRRKKTIRETGQEMTRVLSKEMAVGCHDKITRRSTRCQLQGRVSEGEQEVQSDPDALFFKIR